jgi:hypothetical protein
MSDWIAGLSVGVAAIAAFFGIKQYIINRRKLDLDQYEPRLRIYKEVRRILGIVVRDAALKQSDLLQFYTSVAEADFLFGKEIRAYIDEIFKHGNELCRWVSEYRDYTQEMPADYDSNKVVENKWAETKLAENKWAEIKWFNAQPEVAKRKFAKYLKRK